jgi:N-acyl-D-amino-acid deacylase
MAKVDLVIRGGTVADGTGGALREADVAVDGGKIVAVGEIAESGREEVDAKGLLVTPGFVDVHTHYDGQLTWSERLNPSSGHGVTTVVTGNCGVGFAPCRPQDRDNLIRLMEGVEDIPELVMAAGLPWDWQSFPEFLDAVEKRPHDIDYAVLLPHSPLRVFVMGQRAVDLEPATEADRAQMRQIAKEAMQAGAVGFGTSRNVFHQDSGGAYIPSMSAGEDELNEIAAGLSDAGRGVLQGIAISSDPKLADYELFHRVSKSAGRPVSYTLLQTESRPHLLHEVIGAVERDRAAGIDVKAQVFNRPVGNILGLEASFNPFTFHPFYRANLAHLPVSERVAAMRDPEVRAKLLVFAEEGSHPFKNTLRRWSQMYPMGPLAEYEPHPSTSVAALAETQGRTPDEVVYDLLLEQDGRAMLLVASANYVGYNLDTTLQMLKRDDTVLALGDGGAHYGVICDASYSTYTLTHWVRDRARGERIDLAQAVHMLSDKPARLHRFKDRGRIAPGMKADLNVIDLDKLKLFSPSMIYDLPGGGKRLSQDAEGYVATYVSGVAISRDSQDTGARPGQLVRDAGI